MSAKKEVKKPTSKGNDFFSSSTIFITSFYIITRLQNNLYLRKREVSNQNSQSRRYIQYGQIDVKKAFIILAKMSKKRIYTLSNYRTHQICCKFKSSMRLVAFLLYLRLLRFCLSSLSSNQSHRQVHI